MTARNTTGAEDDIIASCEIFGGNAAACVEIVMRLDAEIEKLKDEKAGLEKACGELETAIEQQRESA